MRNHLFFLGALLILLLASCQKPVYHYLDESTKYVFNVHDTLIYKSSLTSDTFLIKFKRYSYYNLDKIYNYQDFTVIIQHLYNIASIDSVYNDKYPSFSIDRIATKCTNIIWNFACSVLDNDSVISYTLGTHVIPNVYKRNNELNSQGHPVPIKTIWYTHNYGIIAYIKSDDTKFELDDKYFKR